MKPGGRPLTVGAFPCAPGYLPVLYRDVHKLVAFARGGREFVRELFAKAHMVVEGSAARATFDHPKRAPYPFDLAAIGLRELLESITVVAVRRTHRYIPMDHRHKTRNAHKRTKKKDNRRARYINVLHGGRLLCV